MLNCLTDVADKFAFPYLDDVLVYSDDSESHVDHLRKVIQILRENCIKVKEKTIQIIRKADQLFRSYSHKKAYRINTSNIRPVADLVTNVPSNIGQLKTEVGVLGYYRHHAKGFSRIAHFRSIKER